jgi:hypothetical protein
VIEPSLGLAAGKTRSLAFEVLDGAEPLALFQSAALVATRA